MNAEDSAVPNSSFPSSCGAGGHMNVFFEFTVDVLKNFQSTSLAMVVGT